MLNLGVGGGQGGLGGGGGGHSHRGNGEDFRALGGEVDGVLEVGAGAAVAGDGGPVIVSVFDVRGAEVDQRLNGDAHAGLEFFEGVGFAEIGDLGRLVHGAADAVAYEFADDAHATGFDEGLDGVGDVANAVAESGLGDAGAEGVLRGVEKALDVGRGGRQGDGAGGVANPAFVADGDVDGDDVA